jgi:hypothetical protein
MKKSAFILMGLLGAASPWVMAHPGHGALDGTLLHPFPGGGHLLLLAAIALAALLGRSFSVGSDRQDKG